MTGRTPIISLQLVGFNLTFRSRKIGTFAWCPATASLDELPIGKNLDEFDQFILRRDFVGNFDVTFDLKDGLIRIKDPERKYEKKPLSKILINQAKVPIFLDRKVRLKPN